MPSPPALTGPGNHPFTPGTTYIVRKTFTAMRDGFTAGELLVFWKEASSHYDSVTGYFFLSPADFARVGHLDNLKGLDATVKSWDVGWGDNPNPAEFFAPANVW